MLIEAAAKSDRKADLHVVGPAGTDFKSDKCNVLKLHGSVDWCIDPPAIKENHHHTIFCEKLSEVGIAAPGPTKSETVAKLANLWTAAERALREAAAVVFVGYHFPPSDAGARGRLLKAIEGIPVTRGKAGHLSAHVVLGADLAHKDVVRLAALLKSSAKRASMNDATEKRGNPHRFSLQRHPLGAEDFFTVFSRGELFAEVGVQ